MKVYALNFITQFTAFCYFFYAFPCDLVKTIKEFLYADGLVLVGDDWKEMIEKYIE